MPFDTVRVAVSEPQVAVAVDTVPKPCPPMESMRVPAGAVNAAWNVRVSPTFVDLASPSTVRVTGTPHTFTFATPSVWDARSRPSIFVPTMMGWPSESTTRYRPSGTDRVAVAPLPVTCAASVGFVPALASARATDRVFVASVRCAMVPASSQPLARSTSADFRAAASQVLDSASFVTSTRVTLPPVFSTFP